MRALRRVVVADDSRLGLALLEELLEPYRAEVLRAVDGEEAMRLVLAHEPDLVLSDILMPRLDGFGLTRRIRARDEGPQPVVFLTTALTVRGELKTEARRAGADEVLAKPLTSEAFRVALERHFDLRTPGQEHQETVQSPGRYATQRVGREEILAALRGPGPSTAEVHRDRPPAVAPGAPQAPAAPHPRRSSERDVDALLAEALGDLHLER